MRLAGWIVLALGIYGGAARSDPGVPVLDGFRTDDYRAPVPDTVPGATVFQTPEMQDLVARQAAVLIDVLPAPRRPESMRPGIPWLPLRHQSLPGSLWWPDIGRGAIPPAMEAWMRQHLDSVTSGRPDQLVVFFCLRDCWMSWNAAKRAAAMGYRAGWYPEGVDGWRAAGLPLQDIEPNAPE